MESKQELQVWATIDAADIKVGCGKEVPFPVTIRNIQSSKRKFTLRIRSEFKSRDELVEWFVTLDYPKQKEYTISKFDKEPIEEDIDIDGKQSRKISMVISTPKGGYMGDSVTFYVSIFSADGINNLEKAFTLELTPVIVAVKTTVGNEIPVSIDLANKSDVDLGERKQINQDALSEVFSIMAPHEVRGYVFVETMHPDRLAVIAKGIRGFKGIVEGDIKIGEIEHYLTPKPAVAGLELGAFVELIDGPFKGEKAKIMSIDAGKEEVTVQLVESMVPIPVTVRAEAIRMLDKK
jgi:transcriptional antiterminator NusG